MINSTLNILSKLLENYDKLCDLLNDNSQLRYITYDTILDSAGELWFEEKKSIFYSSLEKIANDAMIDKNYPIEKSELLLRLYFKGCCDIYFTNNNCYQLFNFCFKHKKILLKWYNIIHDNIVEDKKIKQNLENTFGYKIYNVNLNSLNETQQINNRIANDFFEYIETKNFNIKNNFHKGVIKLSNSNDKTLIDYYNIKL